MFEVIKSVQRGVAIAAIGLGVPATLAATSADFAALPAELNSSGSSPFVMLNMSHDHQMYFKAYNDFNDLDGDGVIDDTYDNNLEYDGYFDPDYCYNYSTGNGRFEAELPAVDHRCGGTGLGEWSGNFLNWATMTRMDVLRKALYGGKRHEDPETEAVILERALLPTDAHAFAKVYTGADMIDFTPYNSNPVFRTAITFCNLTENPSGANSLSKDVDAANNPPRVYVARGIAADDEWYDWAASAGKQCQFDEDSDSPDSGILGEEEDRFNVLVESCVAGENATNTSRCKLYPNGSYKPYGVLQSYGENQSLRFGLISGSFAKHVAGGLLRRNIGYIAGNTVTTDNEIDTDTGQFLGTLATRSVTTATGAAARHPSAFNLPGVISTLNRLRISQYNFDDGDYEDCNTDGVTAAGFKGSSNCADWGNPLTEIYNGTLRYFSGQTTPSTAYAGDDSVSHINGLVTVPWINPMTADTSCAECAAVVIGVGAGSFDSDDLSSATGITGLLSVSSKTNAVAANEGISGNFLIGDNGTTDTGVCSLKSVSGSNFADLTGLCDSAPDEEGGFQIAGLAHHASTTDLRLLPGNQNVDTYAVKFGEALPVIEAAGITFTPYRAAGNAGSERPCSLVDMQIVTTPGANRGALYAVWDDDSYGTDFNRDAKQFLEYCVGAACTLPPLAADRIRFTTDVVEKTSASRMVFGVVVSGTSADGTVASFEVTALQTPATIGAAPAAVSTELTITGTSSRLRDPLWYAAKYGGFDDIDGGTSGFPDATAEFDTLDENGAVAAGGDGIPDNYFDVKNASRLQSRLDTSLARILATTALSDNTESDAVRFSGNRLAAGGFYRSFYYPTRVGTDRSINWAGSVHGLFVDDNGYLREDNPAAIEGSSTPGQLDAMTIDNSVEFSFNSVTGRPEITRFSSRAPDVIVGVFPFESLNPLWDANNVLAGIDNDEIVNQRDYASDEFGNTVDAASGRYMFTWLDRDGDGAVDDTGVATTDEVIDFVAANFPAGASGADADNFRWLGLTDDSQAETIVNFIRGQEQQSTVGYRSRAITSDAFADADFGVSGTAEAQIAVTASGGAVGASANAAATAAADPSLTLAGVWRVGDIVNSELVVVDAPSAVYDLRFGDRTYAAFRQQYQGRRQMVYVGGNDGVLHAFNAGVPDIVNNRFDSNGHTLGAEMWAYVPGNLLPHLRWLTETDYPHVFYVDGAVQAFDVNIFDAALDENGDGEADYPGGWGTILVAGMRLGGADIAIDTDGVGGADTTLRSAYIVLDITDPERAPKLLAEIAHPDLNFTTGRPTLVKRRLPGSGGFLSPAVNEWALVFGSGPDTSAQGLSTQNSQLFAFDLQSLQMIAVDSGLASGLAESNSFLGDIASIDWDNDFADDTLYVGTVGGTVNAPLGELKRVRLDEGASNGGLASTATASTMIDVGRPIVAAPVTYNEALFADRWVLFGTGRGFVGGDFSSTASQGYYGLREPNDTSGFTYGSVDAADLFDVTGIKTGTDGNIANADDSDVTGDGDPADAAVIETFGELKREIRADGGWLINFSTPAAEAAERSFTGTTKFGNVALFTTFQPDGASCDVDGDGFLYGVNAFTGVAPPFAPLGSQADANLTTLARSVVPLSRGGIPSKPQIYRSEKGGAKIYVEGRKGLTQLEQLDDAPSPSGRQSWEEIDFDR